MRLLMLILIAVCAGDAVFAADTPDSAEARVAAAKRYYEASDFPHLLEASIRAGAAASDPQHADAIAELVMKHIRTEAFADISLNAMVKTFTADELNALADFYGSPVGKSAMSKMPTYLATAMPPLMAEVQRVESEVVEEVRSKRAASTGT
jgi:hypothetical protein